MGNNIAGCMTCRAYHHPREPGTLGSCRYNPPIIRARTIHPNPTPSQVFPPGAWAQAQVHPAAQTPLGGYPSAPTTVQNLSQPATVQILNQPATVQILNQPTAAWPTVREDDWCWRWPAEILETLK